MPRDGADICVLVDGLGWEVIRDRPFLDDILTDRHRVRTILGYSTGAIPTLLTGQYPSGHGHWNLFYRSPETSPFRWTAPLLRLPRHLRESRVVRRLVREVSRRRSGYSGYFASYNLPLDRIRFYDLCETSDIYEPGGLAPARSLFDVMRESGLPYECYNYHRHTDAQILDLVPRRLRHAEVRTYFLYLSGLDAFLHFRISDTEGVRRKLAWYEDRLRRIYRDAEARWGRVRMHVFSDHGMTRIEGTRDLMREVEALDLRIPEDYLPFYDSTMARFWFQSGRAETRLREFLGGLTCGRVLPATEVKELGIHFEDGRYGHLIFVMNPGMLLCPSDLGSVRFDGMHGFHPEEDPSAHAVFLSTEQQARPVAHLSEVFPVLMRELGLEQPAERRAAGAAG